ncbi:MAG TPA: hypothetical protein VF083_00600 [Acidimicrobiia bacterium]
MRSRVMLGLAVALLVVSCGGTGSTTTSVSDAAVTPVPGTDADPTSTTTGSVTSTSSGTAADDPCALATPEEVASAFAATSASGEEGIARNCSFTIVGGVAPSVEVFHYGSSSQWDGVKSGYEDNRGGVTDVAGIGDEAYHPNDVGPYEIVVRSGDVIFAVAVQTGTGGPEVEAAILDLAGAIAGG